MAEERKDQGRKPGGSKPASGRASKGARPGSKSSPSKSSGPQSTRPTSRGGAKSPARDPSKPASRSGSKPAAKVQDKAKVQEGGEPAGEGAGVNREMKRMMKKREGAADRLRRPPTASSRKRTRPIPFLKEVKGELTRVAWPTRPEVVTYSLVVLVTVAFFMIVISGIDFVALRAVLWLIERGGG